jgi:brefeldin A-inhibited guanine nucleotide-exchange protein
MAIVLSTNEGMLVHQSSLLKAVSTVYNVFLLSSDPANQVVAQGGLTQMVHHVFGRVIRPDPKSSSLGRRGESVSLGENEARRAQEARDAGEKDARDDELVEQVDKLTLWVLDDV